MYESRVPTGRTVSVEAKRNLVERSRPRPRVPRATEGAVEHTTHFPRATEGAVEHTTHFPRATVDAVEHPTHSPQKMGTGVDGTYLWWRVGLRSVIDLRSTYARQGF